MTKFGTKLIEIRKARGLTQSEVAEMCKINVRTIQRIESGKVEPRAFTIKLISESLGFDFFETSTAADISNIDLDSKLKTKTIFWYIKDLFNLKTNTMKKVSILTTLCISIGLTLLLFKTEVNAQSSIKKNKTPSIQTYYTPESSKTKRNLQIVFTNELNLENLISIKQDLKVKGIGINYKKLQFDENNKLVSIDFEVNCNDGFKGHLFIDNLNSTNKDKRLGFYRNYSRSAKSPFGTGALKKIIVIDAGHGGIDPGHITNELEEKKIVLNMAEKIKQLYKSIDTEIYLIRELDEYVSLNNRVDIINSLHPEFLISLHTNGSSNKNDKGFKCFVSPQSKFNFESNQLAKKIISHQKNLSTKPLNNANYIILKNLNCPGVLIEMGYLTNSEDRELLTSEKGQLKVINSIIEAIK